MIELLIVRNYYRRREKAKTYLHEEIVTEVRISTTLNYEHCGIFRIQVRKIKLVPIWSKDEPALPLRCRELHT